VSENRAASKNAGNRTATIRQLSNVSYERDFLQTLVDNVPDRIYIKDTWSRFMMVNRAVVERLGVSDPEEVVGKTDFDFYPREYAKETFQDEQRIMKSGQPLIGKTEKVKKNGQTQWVSVTKVPIKDRNGKVIGLAGISRDITTLKRMEEALAYERDLLQALMDNIPDPIYFKDNMSRFTRINREHASWLGIKDYNEAIGKTDFDFYAAEFAQEAYQDEQKIIETKKPLINKIEKIKKPDGTHIWASATKVPIINKKGQVTGIVGISRDITKLRQLEEELIRANEQLRHSNIDLENYTYVVSHDLKAPLRAIRSFSTFLLEDYKDKIDETGQDYLRRIADAASHMDALIEDLLLLSRVGRKFMEFENVDLNQLLKEIVTDIEPLIKKRNGEVVSPQLPTILIQRTWLKQLFMNLIDNGLKFNKSKVPRVEISYEEKETEYLFKVQDNGIGIEEKYHEKIFNLFERLHTREEYEGTGAGLAICKKIVLQFGGKIWIKSQTGKGTTFFFTLPKKMNSTV
jgi:two-component system sensor histidine kinase/response regulator